MLCYTATALSDSSLSAKTLSAERRHQCASWRCAAVCRAPRTSWLPIASILPAELEATRCSFANFRGRRMRGEKETALREIDALRVRIREGVDWFFGRVYQPAGRKPKFGRRGFVRGIEICAFFVFNHARYFTDFPSTIAICDMESGNAKNDEYRKA